MDFWSTSKGRQCEIIFYGIIFMAGGDQMVDYKHNKQQAVIIPTTTSFLLVLFVVFVVVATAWSPFYIPSLCFCHSTLTRALTWNMMTFMGSERESLQSDMIITLRFDYSCLIKRDEESTKKRAGVNFFFKCTESAEVRIHDVCVILVQAKVNGDFDNPYTWKVFLILDFLFFFCALSNV